MKLLILFTIFITMYKTKSASLLTGFNDQNSTNLTEEKQAIKEIDVIRQITNQETIICLTFVKEVKAMANDLNSLKRSMASMETTVTSLMENNTNMYKELNKSKSQTIEKGCEFGWRTYRDHCYMYFSQRLNWFEATMFCRQRGSYLVHINNHAENEWLAKQYTGYLWIDATDIAREGHWRSLYTGKAAYTNWSMENPDNWRGKQHCAKLNWGGPGLWDDDNCFEEFPFICEA